MYTRRYFRFRNHLIGRYTRDEVTTTLTVWGLLNLEICKVMGVDFSIRGRYLLKSGRLLPFVHYEKL